MLPTPPPSLLDVLDTWLDAQSHGAREPDQVLHRPPSAVTLQILVSAGPHIRTSRCLAAAAETDECCTSSVNRLLKTTWEAVREEVEQTASGNTYKWWEGVVLLGNSSLRETARSRRVMLLGMDGAHQDRWLEWRRRNVEEGYRRVYTVGVAFGVSHAADWKDSAGYGRRPGRESP